MKILLLTPDMPYPSESGAALRNFGIIRGLSAAGHKLTLLSFSEKQDGTESEVLLRYCDAVERVALPGHGKLRRIGKLLSTDSADMEFRLKSARFSDELSRLLDAEDFDLVQFSGLELGGYLGQIKAQKKGAKVVYDSLNAEAELQRVIAKVDRGVLRRLPAALYSEMQSRRLARFEARVCRSVDAVIAVSGEDRDFLNAYDGAPIHVVPNGISVDDYQPPAENVRAAGRLVFSGKMDYRPNVDAVEWFCEAVLPLVRAGYPEAQLVIVGRNPHRRIELLANSDWVEITGWVESVQAHLQGASVFVVPLRMGSGTRLKILQAMAAGCAVVSTSIGAAGLNDAVREALVIADRGEDFARAIAELFSDTKRRDALGALARERVRLYYDWSVLIPKLLSAYEGLGLG